MAILKYNKDNKWTSLYSDAIKNRLKKSSNLSDLENIEEARSHLELTGDNNHTHYHDDRYLPKIEAEKEQRIAENNSIKEMIKSQTNEINNSINTAIDSVNKTIEEKIDSKINDKYSELKDDIKEEADIRASEDAKLKNSISSLTNTINSINNSMDSKNDELQQKLENEISERKNQDTLASNDRNSIKTKLNNEIEERRIRILLLLMIGIL